MRSIVMTLSICVFAATGLARDIRGGGSMSEIVAGNNRFAVDLDSRLRTRPGNSFFSPLSVSTALAMTSAGARGETAEQMARTLHFPTVPGQLHPAFASLLKALDGDASERGDRLVVANRLWGQRGYHYSADFLAITRDQYGAPLAEVDFEAPEPARRQINAWVAEKTRNKIKDLIPAGLLAPTTRLVLTNAIHFKGVWATPFRKAATREAPFHLSADRDVTAPMMSLRHELRFREGDGIKALELPYAGGGIAMVVLLPDAVDGLPALEARLTDENLGRWLSGLEKREVEVQLPRFQMSSQFSLADALAVLGMPLAFDPKRADFSGMTDREPLFLSAVIHKAFVDVDEEGTEAAAATGVMMAPRAMRLPSKPAVFRADHPFRFLIRDNRTGSILFLGRLTDPTG